MVVSVAPTTGSIEIEHGGSVAAATAGYGGSSDGGGAKLRFDRFGARQENIEGSGADDRWTGVGVGEGMDTQDKDRRWAATAAAAAAAATVAMDRDRRGSGLGGEARNAANAWPSSSAVGVGAGGGAGGVVGRDVGGGGGRGWRTEADADLSDIKATMRRIDGEREIKAKRRGRRMREGARERAHYSTSICFLLIVFGSRCVHVCVFCRFECVCVFLLTGRRPTHGPTGRPTDGLLRMRVA